MNIKGIGYGRIVFILTALLCFVLGGCGNSNDRRSGEDSGNAALVVMALSAANATSVTVTITAADIASPVVSSLTKSGNQWGGTIGGIPAGSNRTFTLSARDASGSEIYHGQVTGITVTRGATVSVAINAQQVAPVQARKNSAPVIDALIASAVTAAPGDVVNLSVNAHDPDAGDTLTYAWSVAPAAGGTFATPTAASTTWTAPAAGGTYTIKINVSDQKNAKASMSVDITVTANAGKGKASITVSLNTWPVVDDVTATPTRINLGEMTSLDVVASDSDGDTLAYLWSSDCGGTFGSKSAKSSTFTLSTVPATNACTFTVAVTDGKGGNNSGSVTIPTGPAPAVNLPPEVLTTYQSSQGAATGGTVTLRAQAVDPNGTAITFAWLAPTGTLGTPITTANSSEVVWTAPSPFATDTQIQVTVTDASGQTTVQPFAVQVLVPTWHTVTIAGLPTGATLSGVWARTPDDVFVAAFVPTDVPDSYVYHWNGSSWSLVLSIPGHQAGNVYGTSSTEVFVLAGKCAAGTAAGCGSDAGGRIFRSTDGGANWLPQSLPADASTTAVGNISGTAGNIHVNTGNNSIIRFDGTTWTTIYSSGSTLTLVSANEGYYVGCWGWGSWNGTAWSYHGNQFDFCDVASVWGMRDNTGALQLYAVGNNNFSNGVRVWRFNEATQSFGSKYGYVYSDGNASNIGSANGIWGSAANDVYVTGRLPGLSPPASAGRLYHFDGTSWSRVLVIGDIPEPRSISGSAYDNVWVALTTGNLLHFGQ